MSVWLVVLCLSLADGMCSLAMAASSFKLIFVQGMMEESWSNFLIAGVEIYDMIAVFLLTDFIAIQRFIAVLFPLKCRRILTKKTCIAVLISLCIISAILTTMLLFGLPRPKWLGYVPISTCLALLVAYGAICYNLSRQNLLLHGAIQLTADRDQNIKDLSFTRLPWLSRSRFVFSRQVSLHLQFLICPCAC